jgi:hypothetical protein
LSSFTNILAGQTDRVVPDLGIVAVALQTSLLLALTRNWLYWEPGIALKTKRKLVNQQQRSLSDSPKIMHPKTCTSGC